MIKISYKNITDEYYTLISASKMTKFNNISFETYYNRYVKSKLGYELKKILCGDYEKLLEIKKHIGTKYSSKNNIVIRVEQFIY